MTNIKKGIWGSAPIKAILARLTGQDSSPDRYIQIRRNIVILMVLVTFIPLLIMAAINYHNYQETLEAEVLNPIHTLTNKTKHTFELFIEERISVVKFVASAYSFEDLSQLDTLKKVFRVLRKEFGDFVDLGLIDHNGIQVNYVGPYELTGKDYTSQNWFQEVSVRGVHVSDVFMGYRKFPHMVIAVKHLAEDNTTWIVRATIDTQKFNSIISSMALGSENDAFLINRAGVIQTYSKFFGDVMERFPFPVPPGNYGTKSIEVKDDQGRALFVVFAPFEHHAHILVLIKPLSILFQTWFALKSEMLITLLIGCIIALVVIFKLADMLVKRIREADIKREAAFRELEHSQKLSSLGRLAAGVAHEINNPLAIINQKSGLMKDIIEVRLQDTEQVPKFIRDIVFYEEHSFLNILQSINQSIERCKTITHRLLGFARQMDVKLEVLNITEVIEDTVSFIEREAQLRRIEIRLDFEDNLPLTTSDRGQLQQVFLNILTNALAAVENSGLIMVTVKAEGSERLVVMIKDNGIGIDDKDINHIFEPFFTTKRDYGTGLGLPITYGIVTKLGGDIKVESKKGQGTTFNVYLPTR
jgi:two-component system, NtrC family, sensor kinase